MTLKPGLVSVTFRSLSPSELIDAAVRSGLSGIEWGGDVHVPHGRVSIARQVAAETRDAGLSVASYGSYYRFDESDVAFSQVLATAIGLGAPVVRVWAGRKGSAEVDESEFARIVTESRRIADEAADAGIRVCYEYHANTLTDTTESAVRLLREVDHPNIRTYWQPPNGRDVDYCRDSLSSVLPWLEYIHCFHWTGHPRERRPLAEGASRWVSYLSIAADRDSGLEPRWVLLEFVPDDSVEALVRDAAVLRNWIERT